MTLAGANIQGCASASLFSYQIDRIIALLMRNESHMSALGAGMVILRCYLKMYNMSPLSKRNLVSGWRPVQIKKW